MSVHDFCTFPCQNSDDYPLRGGPVMSIRVAALCFISLFAVSCAQGGASPTSPSALTAPAAAAGPSAGYDATGRWPAAAAAGPSAGYDATGRWRFVQTSANPNLNDTWDADVLQDPTTGNLTVHDDDGHPVTLERLSQGTGVIITYRIAFISVEGSGPCDLLRIQGTARLDTTTNTMTLPIRLKQLGCENERAGAVVVATKLS